MRGSGNHFLLIASHCKLPDAHGMSASTGWTGWRLLRSNGHSSFTAIADRRLLLIRWMGGSCQIVILLSEVGAISQEDVECGVVCAPHCGGG